MAPPLKNNTFLSGRELESLPDTRVFPKKEVPSGLEQYLPLVRVHVGYQPTLNSTSH